MSRPERVVAWILGGLVVAGVALVPVATRWVLADDNYWIQVLIWILFFA
ncbi:MAG: hypothetical protein HYY88_07825, partial [candidate division NC10 bacterium]|nr:hypothetical protein [candidate division NC10 bacterium]